MLLMNSYQLNDIIYDFKEYRYHTKITVLQQIKNYTADVLEELSKYIRAEAEYDKVSALCNILAHSFITTIATSDQSNASGILRVKRYDLVNDMQELLNSLLRTGIYASSLHVTEIKRLAVTKLYDMSYDPYMCMKEVLKKIETERWCWDKETKKWIKDTSPEAQVEWYKANYEYCKLNSNDIDKH